MGGPAVEDYVCTGTLNLGVVPERRLQHHILAPFELEEAAEVVWIAQGNFAGDVPVARLRTRDGSEHEVSMLRSWPVRRALPAQMLRRGDCERIYPEEPMTTTMRLIDTFFPIARGGTACIPGPFGAGKTVLQGLIARYSDVDVVIVVACGERAGEVVETIHEFPQMREVPRPNAIERSNLDITDGLVASVNIVRKHAVKDHDAFVAKTHRIVLIPLKDKGNGRFLQPPTPPRPQISQAKLLKDQPSMDDKVFLVPRSAIRNEKILGTKSRNRDL